MHIVEFIDRLLIGGLPGGRRPEFQRRADLLDRLLGARAAKFMYISEPPGRLLMGV